VAAIGDRVNGSGDLVIDPRQSLQMRTSKVAELLSSPQNTSPYRMLQLINNLQGTMNVLESDNS
jgi:hypothetical protein